MPAPEGTFEFVSSVPGIAWPAVPEPRSAAVLGLLFQLQSTQWWPPEALHRHQFRQLAVLLEHAHRTVAFYRRRFDEMGLDGRTAAEPQQFARLPILRRRDLQTHGDDLISTAIPPGHGAGTVRVTGGSTGEPVRVRGTQLTAMAWNALTLRDHFWHRRDMSAKLAAIRFCHSDDAPPPHGRTARNWGAATAGMLATGPAAVLDIRSTTAQQAAWLVAQQPDYLLTYPTVILALARHFREHSLTLARLREVRSFGEVLEPQVREVCRQVWNVPVVDAYSSEEFGYLALQCPDHEHYHVQSESVLLEVLDEQDRPCRAGRTGRVVVTGLHNFAMPLVRYDIGDYAEVGPPCPCGRGLPVLNRIWGRQRNMFVLPGGQTRWPMIEAADIARVFDELPPVAKFQLIQRSLDELELLLVAARRLSGDEERRVAQLIARGLGHAFRLAFRYVDDIPRSPHGKHEEFRSDVAWPPGPGSGG